MEDKKTDQAARVSRVRPHSRKGDQWPRKAAFSVIAALCLTAGPGQAQPVEAGEERQIADVLTPVPGARICFARDYDAVHLKAHPDQKVRSIGFRLAYFVHDPDEYYPKGQRNYYFELRTVLRRSGRQVTAGGECVPSQDGRNIYCGVECDGGGVLIRRTSAKDKLLVDLEATGRIRMSDGCDDEAGIDLESGADDKKFLLSALPARACPPYEDW